MCLDIFLPSGCNANIIGNVKPLYCCLCLFPPQQSYVGHTRGRADRSRYIASNYFTQHTTTYIKEEREGEKKKKKEKKKV